MLFRSSPLSKGLVEILENDPRPRYHDDPERVYGLEYDGMEIKFCVSEDNLTVISVEHIR